MTITQSDPFKGVVRISRDAFSAIIRQYGNPALAAERDPGEYWDYIVSRGMDPLYILAQFNHESNLGTKGTATQTRSWGNTRTPNFGATPVGTVPGRSGTFPVWANWMDGLISTVERYLAPNWVYATRTTIAEIFIRPQGIPVWAPAGDLNDPAGYLRSVLDYMNANAGSNPQPPPGGTMRIIVSAGHEHIGAITADKIGQASADALRTATGALGREAEWTAPWADELVRLLAAAGVDAVRTDAVYHADVYGGDADLLICGHCDGVGGTGHAQWCMIGTVHAGPSSAAADSRADAFAADWQAIYPQQSGIADNGPITVDMQQYYGGWYRGAETPMVLAEHCILGDAGGWRADAPTPQQGAAWDFAALAEHFNLGNAPQPPAPAPTSTNVVDGFDIGPGFHQLYTSVSEETAARLRIFGLVKAPGQYDGYLVYPANDAQRAKGLTEVVHPVVICDFERVPVIWDRGRTAAPFDVRTPLQHEYLGVSSDPVIQAIIHSMNLVNEPI